MLLYDSGIIKRTYAQYAHFVTILDTRNGLLDYCVAEGCLTAAQVEDIENQKSDGERNRLILRIFLRKGIDCVNKVLMCLIKSKQGHVASMLAGEESCMFT